MRHAVSIVAIAWLAAAALAADPVAAQRSPQEVMGDRGFVRHRGAWRTVQEIELLERAEAGNLARKEWVNRLERLRRQLDKPGTADRAAEEIRGIADPAAVPALVARLPTEPVPRVRDWYVGHWPGSAPPRRWRRWSPRRSTTPMATPASPPSSD